MADAPTLTTIASIISGFGIAMLFFRIQRELQAHQQLEPQWIPWADRLLIAATLISLVLVILPLLAFGATSPHVLGFSSAACAAVTVMAAGYVVGILAHYRLLFGKNRRGPRENPEPAERVVVYAGIAVALLAFARIILSPPH